MIRTSATVALVCCLSLALCSIPGTSASSPRGKLRAVSLRVLQQRLEGPRRGSSLGELLTLCGLTTIQGYVVDEKKRDLILFGEIRPGAPPLHTEDLVVALRNARRKYVTTEGNAVYYSAPGCSIDPDPAVLRKLTEIAARVTGGGSEQTVEAAINSWHAAVRSPQSVRVMGIPRYTHFAKVMVDADYYMKRLVNGSVSLDIPGFVSLVDMTMSKAQEDIKRGRAISVPLNSMNRFWFCPGNNRYAEDQGIVLLKQCPVTLLTEEEHLTHSGASETGRPDPLADSFARSFSAHYAEVARKRPIYQELEGLFRFVALAKIMEYRKEPVEFEYLLDRFPVPEVKVGQTLAGISYVKHFQHRTELPNGYEIAQLWLPSCGGVSVDLEVTRGSFVRAKAGQARQLRTAVLRTRPSAEVLFWDFRPA